MKTTLTALLLSATLAGCASSNNYKVEYISEPSNAAVICNGQTQGYTPLTLYYEIDREKNPNSFRTVPCKAVWVSGAMAVIENVIPLSQYPNGVSITVRRPSGAQNYTQDAQAAMYGAQQRENDRRLQRQQNRQEMQYLEEQLRNIGRTNNTNCYTVSNQVFCRSY